jgi:hypothetical protein
LFGGIIGVGREVVLSAAQPDDSLYGTSKQEYLGNALLTLLEQLDAEMQKL